MRGKHSRNRKNRPLVIVLSIAMIFSALTAFWSFGEGSTDSGTVSNSPITIAYDQATQIHSYNGVTLYCMNNLLHWPHNTDSIVAPQYELQSDADTYIRPLMHDPSKYEEFREKLAVLLYAGYPSDALKIMKDYQATETDINTILKTVPDEIKSQYTDLQDGLTCADFGNKNVTAFLQDVMTKYYSKDDTEKTLAQSIINTLYYKAAFALGNADSQNDVVNRFNGNGSGNSDILKETATQNAIWALMTDYGIYKNQYASGQLFGLEKTLYDTAQDTSVLLNEEPKKEDVSIGSAEENVSDRDALTFTYNKNDGKWYTGNLAVNEPANYHGSYTISTNDSNISVDGQSGMTVSGNTSFRLVSSTQPAASTSISATASIPYIANVYVYTPILGTGSLPAGDTKGGFQSMIGVNVPSKEISTSANLLNNTGGLTLTKSFSFPNGMTEAQQTAEKNKVTFTIQGDDNNIKNMTSITVKYSDLDTSGSKTIYGLTPGEYKVTESELGNDAYNVTTTYANSGTVTVHAGETASEIITNTYSKKPTGSLTLKKSFDFGKDTDHPNPDTSKITFTLQGQGDISGFSKTVSYKDFQNGSYTVKDLPVGTYKITESGADVSGYTDSLTVSVNGKTTGTIEVAKDGTAAAELKNTYTPTGSLTIHKSFVNSPLTETQKNGITFTITGKNTKETRTVSFDKFSTDGTYTFTDLPVDTYTIKESNAGGTVLTAYKDFAGNILKDQQAAISKGTETKVDVTNTYPDNPPIVPVVPSVTVTPASADLRVQKLIIGNDGNWPEGASFTMNLQAKDNAPMPNGTVNGVKSITVSSESPASFGTIQYEKAGTYHYIVTESKGSDKNFTYDETQHPVTVTVTESADHKLTASISGGNSSGIVEITNRYTKPKNENDGNNNNNSSNNGNKNNTSGKNASGGNKVNGSTSNKTSGSLQPANTKTLKNSLAKNGAAASSGNASGSLVRTGDQTELTAMIALLLTSACGLAAVLALKKKRRDDRASEDRQ